MIFRILFQKDIVEKIDKGSKSSCIGRGRVCVVQKRLVDGFFDPIRFTSTDTEFQNRMSVDLNSSRLPVDHTVGREAIRDKEPSSSQLGSSWTKKS